MKFHCYTVIDTKRMDLYSISNVKHSLDNVLNWFKKKKIHSCYFNFTSQENLATTIKLIKYLCIDKTSFLLFFSFIFHRKLTFFIAVIYENPVLWRITMHYQLLINSIFFIWSFIKFNTFSIFLRQKLVNSMFI